MRRKSIPAVLNFFDSFLFPTILLHTQIIISSWSFIFLSESTFRIYKQINETSSLHAHFSHCLINSIAMFWSISSWLSQIVTKHFIDSSANWGFSKALKRYSFKPAGGLNWWRMLFRRMKVATEEGAFSKIWSSNNFSYYQFWNSTIGTNIPINIAIPLWMGNIVYLEYWCKRKLLNSSFSLASRVA